MNISEIEDIQRKMELAIKEIFTELSYKSIKGWRGTPRTSGRCKRYGLFESWFGGVKGDFKSEDVYHVQIVLKMNYEKRGDDES